jgi:integrase
MKEDIARARLAGVPVEIANRMLAERTRLPAGAISVVARFFSVLTARNELASCPTRASFEAACGSESTLALLLRILERYGPEVGLAEGRVLRQAYYGARSSGKTAAKRQTSSGETPFPQPRDWPGSWKALLPGLLAAPIADSSIARHIFSINRCADVLPELTCPPRLGWLLAWELAEALQGQKGKAADPQPGEEKTDVGPHTAANYLGALVSLGVHGGLDPSALAGLRSVQAHLQRKAKRAPKRKSNRIEALYEQGGYAEILRVITRELERAEALPAWRAEAESARATAAILAVAINMPARTGDLAAWRIGEELIRMPEGIWRLRWRQGKTGHWQNAGTLWPEVALVLDLHVLGGRPTRYVQSRYGMLQGLNWLSFSAHAPASKWPSEKVRAALGIPLHDLRTLAADYLRLHDPATAPEVVSSLLGHATRQAGEEYRALCSDSVAQREWMAARAKIAG